jgi:hypothetical protein
MNSGYGTYGSHSYRFVEQSRNTARNLAESLRRTKPTSDDQLGDRGVCYCRATPRELLNAASTQGTHRVLRNVDVPIDAVFAMLTGGHGIRRNCVYARRRKLEERWPAVPPPLVVERGLGDLKYRILLGRWSD